MKAHQAQYVPGLDLLRFFAACIVMVFHLAFWSWAFPTGQVAIASHGVANFKDWTTLAPFGWAGVQIFFVISGFVIVVSAERSSAYKFFVSRFTRLVPAVWICATIALLAWLLVDVGTRPLSLLAMYVRSVGFFPKGAWIDSVYWTLGVEICFYALMFVLLMSHRQRWIKPIMCSIGLISTLFWIGYTAAAQDRNSALFQIFSQVQWSRFAQLLLIQHGVFFAFGVLLWSHFLKQSSRGQLAWLALFAVGGCLQIAGESVLKLEKTGLSFSPLTPCVIWLSAMLFFWIAVANNARAQQLPAWCLQLLRRLGLMTYPLYLLHNVTGGALLGAFIEAGIPSSVALAITIAAVLTLSWWISKVPEPALQKATRAVFDAARARWQSTSRSAGVRDAS
ncbi:acyltransferase family protein [Peristeroidobacter soli]|jgi:peptidoglycan/LPS O-acetylase OafA/YrhL|uniref:acyltransferase family protein n=1 Tax=Peristeroidobacter soli TaxID=2497877 RepID=UPI00101BE029|nr:acyltransferase [Peristeroidobacter soli]